MSSLNSVSVVYTNPYGDESNSGDALEDSLANRDEGVPVFVDGTFEDENEVDEWENFWNALTEEEQDQTLVEGDHIYWNGETYQVPQRADQAREIQEHSENVSHVYPGIIINDQDIQEYMPNFLGSSKIESENNGTTTLPSPSLEENTSEELAEGYEVGMRTVGRVLAYDVKLAEQIVNAADQNEYEEPFVIRNSISVINKTLRNQLNDIEIDEINQPDLSSEDQNIVDIAETNFLL